MRPYELGHPELDRLVKELVVAAGDGAHSDLVEETIVSALKLMRDGAGRGELKLVNAALKEMRYSFRVFSAYRDIRKVAIFGSARTTEDDANYKLASAFAREMAETRNWMVITGAGPGIMAAGNEGAGDASFGVKIRLPFEASPNPNIPPNRLINFKYFFTRKLIFVKESDAFALFPGGFGTLDEAFETITLIQTGKSDLHPVVLIEAPGTDYWATWKKFVEVDLLGNGMISPEDLNLFDIVHTVEEAADLIGSFYRNYHSTRYVNGRLVIRLHRAPGPAELAALNRDFADLVEEGTIERIPSTPAESADVDHPELERIAFTFARRNYGRLRVLVDRLNELGP